MFLCKTKKKKWSLITHLSRLHIFSTSNMYFRPSSAQNQKLKSQTKHAFVLSSCPHSRRNSRNLKCKHLQKHWRSTTVNSKCVIWLSDIQNSYIYWLKPLLLSFLSSHYINSCLLLSTNLLVISLGIPELCMQGYLNVCISHSIAWTMVLRSVTLMKSVYLKDKEGKARKMIWCHPYCIVK